MTKIGDRITILRKQKSWSQSDLAEHIHASREAIGKYERNEAVPSVEIAKKIADAFEVTLDYLVDDNAQITLDKKNVKRLQDIAKLPEQEKEHIIKTIDALLRDAKARITYAH